MTTKTIAWATGSGNITLTYTGQGNESISVSSTENDSFDDRSQSVNIVTTAGSPEKAVSVLIKQQGKKLPVGEVFNFEYTGSVQQVTLPKGKYKLQCWGAQGGTSSYSGSATGSKGGYSEGVITLTKTTTLFVFVGGKGDRSLSSSLANGGWNGGGGSVGTASYSSDGTAGYSYPACGGGATDISTVTSSMSYSSGRTNRSSASLLARCIVAGGGAGGSYAIKSTTTTGTKDTTISNLSSSSPVSVSDDGTIWRHRWVFVDTIEAGTTIGIKNTSGVSEYWIEAYKAEGSGWINTIVNNSYTVPSNARVIQVWLMGSPNSTVSATFYKKETTTSTTKNTYSSNQSQQGGGASGKGQYPGTQSAGGNGNGDDGGFGYGGSQKTTGYRYCSGGGGGGWYGGGTAYSDSSTSYVNYTGGGSGFVNTAANTSYRPSGYTGLQLDSGTTKDGSTSFESTSGGSETGHSGNGYARITVLE